MDNEERKTLPRGIWWAIGGLAVLFVVGSIVAFYFVRAKAKTELTAQADGLTAGVTALQNMDFAAAAAQFKIVAASSSDLQGAAGLFSLFTSGKNPFGAFIDLSKQLASLSSGLAAAENDLFAFIGTPSAGQNSNPAGGTDLAGDLGRLRDTLHAIDADSQNLSAAMTLVNTSLPGGLGLVSLQTRLHSAETFLDAFVPWLSDPAPHHILVLLQNPSELRATGGFLGSYADVTIASGTIANISVHDIAEVDTGFGAKIVPPKPLQLEVSKWRPADANWFFDFPTSASETISFFEASQLYAASGTKFDGAIAVSPKVVSDLLAITGPVAVSSTKTVFDSSNLLVQVQNIVQAGQVQLRQGSAGQTQSLALRSSASQSVGGATYPKKVLADLAQAIFTKLASSMDSTNSPQADDEKQVLFGLAAGWADQKDVMAYFKDPAFENFAENLAVAGDVYELPQNFEGDYLALASTNINGQKSDLYVSETVNWQSQINDDGTVADHLMLVRTHAGDTSPYWWYRAPNQSYLQLFVPPATTLVNETGGLSKTIPAPLNYAKSGYRVDPLVAAIESSTQPVAGFSAVAEHDESGKTVFATWDRVAAGSSSTLSFDYSHRLYLPVADGTPYQFVFEKQAGTDRQYNFEIDAPLGYVFAETGLAAWTYDSANPSGRMVVDLTLQKIGE
jgi:hypothetical protein